MVGTVRGVGKGLEAHAGKSIILTASVLFPAISSGVILDITAGCGVVGVLAAGYSFTRKRTATRRLLDRAPAGGTDPDSTTRATVHLECERQAETHIRALLLQAMSASGLAPTGLRARRERDETTSLRATVAITGDVTAALEQVVSRLSLEPGVHDLHWHLEAEHDRTEQEALA